ncbi:MAG: riboflavin synthase [Opitutales bacterium]|nr:riboflavin synthase [Opitutales bacterium]
MFTGLVQATGKVYSLELQASGATRLALESPLLAAAELGASIAVNGCCLTATSVQGNVATFDLLAETLRLTNLGDLKVGSLVNLEPSLRPTDRMGGHFVTGHIDACGSVDFFGADGADWRLDINAPTDVLRHVVKKGCVAVDGMSLTVADVLPTGFRIWIIPHTLSVTNLASRQAGQRVNLESDLLAKYAEKLLVRA